MWRFAAAEPFTRCARFEERRDFVRRVDLALRARFFRRFGEVEKPEANRVGARPKLAAIMSGIDAAVCCAAPAAPPGGG